MSSSTSSSLSLGSSEAPPVLSINAFAFAFDQPAMSDRVLVIKRGTQIEMKDIDSSESSKKGGTKRKASSQLNRASKRTTAGGVKSLDDDSGLVTVKEEESGVIRKIHVNSLCLACQSPVFKTMLTNGMQETISKEIVLEVKDETEANLHVSAVRFLYSGELPPDAKAPELLGLLLVGDKFEIASLVQSCSAALCKQMTVELATQVFELTSRLNLSKSCRSVEEKSTDAIVEEFKVTYCLYDEVLMDCCSFQDLENKWRSKEFLELPLRSVCVVLSSDKLLVHTENIVFQAAREWWINCPFEEDHEALAVLKTVRLFNLTRGFFRNEVALDSSLVYGDVCRAHLSEAVSFHMANLRDQRLLASEHKDDKLFRKRAGYMDAMSGVINWTVQIDPDESKCEDESDAVWIGGYQVYGQLREDPVYIYSGIESENDSRFFCVRFNRRVEARNAATGQFEVIQNRVSTQAVGVCKLGYLWEHEPNSVSAKWKWNDLVPARCRFVNASNKIELRMAITILDEAWWRKNDGI